MRRQQIQAKKERNKQINKQINKENIYMKSECVDVCRVGYLEMYKLSKIACNNIKICDNAQWT
jgi:hypothetical protein